MITKIIYDSILKQLAPKLIKNNILLEVAEILIKQHIIDNIQFLVFLDRINEMQEWELDYVAKELHVDYYDYTMSLENKRKACQESLAIHNEKGTVSGIKRALNIFFKDSSLEEWYQYEGEPGYFRIRIDGKIPNNLSQIRERIESVKKKSQHLDKIIFLSNSNQKLHYGTYMMHGRKCSTRSTKLTLNFLNSK